jgi:hypothetical protein
MKTIQGADLMSTAARHNTPSSFRTRTRTSFDGCRRLHGVLALIGAAAALPLAGGGCDDTTIATSDAGASTGIASPALAILESDYAKTSVSLYAPATGKLVDACVTSAMTGPTLTEPLSGNVLLPTQAQLGGELVLIDSKTAVLTFMQPGTCAARGQLSVSTGGFKSFPHDVVTIAPGKAYVTRYETNAMATADPADFDEGGDVLIVDPLHLTVTGRIDVTAYATPGPAGEPTQARPDRALVAGGLVYVSINNISGDFAATGAGRVVVIDPTSDAVVGMIDLPNQKNCSGLTYVVATKRLYVACGGAFSEPANQIAESALVEVDLSGAAPVMARVLQASTLATGGLNLFYAAVAGDAAFVGTLGVFPDMTTGAPGTSDAFYYAPLDGSPAVKLAEGGAGDLGVTIVDPASNKAFLADGSFSKPLVHVFDATTGLAKTTADFDPNPATHLPPRSISWY